ncbi:hypothetical protein BK648_24775 [Pseudomonas poae]|uniref:TetR family transcriptional regulator n=1 Tax=Pseudomonas poae TaxID=200451 RepID=A0A423ERN1_9PSED|nr:TetR/AcrR family transcriptional regulator [Pseudomonas poae]ROM33975.1 hypothetical protein BK648_24775 [Pseudomonas poae]
MPTIAARSPRRPPAETRRLMLKCIGELLENKAPWEIRASHVAAAAGTTQPNFYSHFRNIEEAIMARAGQVWDLYPVAELAQLLERGLNSGDDEPLQHFFMLTVGFWCRHGGLLRAVSRLSGDENPAVRGLRHHAQYPLISLCEAAVGRAQATGNLPPSLHLSLAANAAMRFLDEAASHFQIMRDAGELSSETIAQTIVPMFRRLLSGQ